MTSLEAWLQTHRTQKFNRSLKLFIHGPRQPPKLLTHIKKFQTGTLHWLQNPQYLPTKTYKSFQIKKGKWTVVKCHTDCSSKNVDYHQIYNFCNEDSRTNMTDKLTKQNHHISGSKLKTASNLSQ